jgi:chromosome segregation ATPase
MNGRVIAYIIGAIGTLFGIGGAAYGADQHTKRKAEEQAFRARLQQLQTQLAGKEDEFAQFFARFGEKNDQVRSLAVEVTNLRATIEAMRKSA